MELSEYREGEGCERGIDTESGRERPECKRDKERERDVRGVDTKRGREEGKRKNR